MTNEQLVICIKAGEDTVQNMEALYLQVRWFIRSVAWRYRAYENLEDLEQEGFLALYTAMEGYDPALGYKFLTYAEHHIRQRIGRYIADHSTCIRIPVHSREKIRQYKKLCSEYQKTHNESPSDEEICHYLVLSLDQVTQLKKDAIQSELVSLSSPIGGEGGELTIADTVIAPVDVESEMMDKIQAEQLKREIWTCVDALDGRQPDVIRRRYEDRLTLDAVGQAYGITKSAVRQIESKALRELRKPRNAKKLEPYLDEVRSQAMAGGGSRRFSETWTSSTERTALRLLGWK